MYSRHRYFWSEKEIFKGDRGAIFGLLETLHKYYDGIWNTNDSVLIPYYGNCLPTENFISPLKKTEEIPSILHNEQAANSPKKPESVPIIQEHRLGSTISSKEGLILDLSVRPQQNDISKPEEMSSPAPPVPQPYPTRLDSSKHPQSGKQLFHFSRAEDIEPKRSTSKNNIDSFRESPQRAQDFQGNELNIQGEKIGKFHSQTLLEWMKNLGINLPKGTDLESPILDQLKDG